MARADYLMKRGKRWYFHRRVPGDLKEVFTREFWRESLNTDSETEAGIGVIAHIQRTNDLIAQARQGTLRRLDDDQIDDLSMQWAAHYAEVAEELMVAEMFPHLQVGDVFPFSSAERYGEEPKIAVLKDRGQLASEVRRWLSSYREEVRAEGADWEKLLDACHTIWAIKHSNFSLNYNVEALRVPGLKPGESLALDKIEELAKAKHLPATAATLGTAFKLYLDEKSSPGRSRPISDRTKQEWNTALRRFCEVNGDLEIERIQRTHVISFRDALRRLPGRPPRAIGQKKVHAQIAWAEQNDHSRLSDTTVAKQITAISTVLEFTYRETDLIVRRSEWENPCAGIAGGFDRGQQATRKPFTDQQITTLFDPATYAPRHASDFWLPLMLYFTGARLTEIGQLLGADVIADGATPHLRITLDNQRLITERFGSHAEKRLKNRYSERLVPLHDDLIEIGILDYVSANRRSGELFLFPDLDHESGEARARNLSRRVLRKLRRLDQIDAGAQVLHSFRHYFKMKSLEVGGAEGVTKLVMGHDVKDDVSISHYARHLQHAVDESKRLIIDKIPLQRLDVSGLRVIGQKLKP